MYPGQQQFGVRADGVLQVTAAQALVAQQTHAQYQQAIGVSQRIVRGAGAAGRE